MLESAGVPVAALLAANRTQLKQLLAGMRAAGVCCEKLLESRLLLAGVLEPCKL